MKKIKLEKLSLNKEAITKLNNDQLMSIQGGDTITVPCTGYSNHIPGGCPAYTVVNCGTAGCP